MDKTLTSTHCAPVRFLLKLLVTLFITQGLSAHSALTKPHTGVSIGTKVKHIHPLSHYLETNFSPPPNMSQLNTSSQHMHLSSLGSKDLDSHCRKTFTTYHISTHFQQKENLSQPPAAHLLSFILH